MPLAARFAGCLLGTALGDAVGELAFTCQQREALERRVTETVSLRYTDDTATTVVLAAHLLERGGMVDTEALGAAFHRAYAEEPWRGYGPGPPCLFRLVAERGLPYEEAAKTLYGGEGSLGNGAAMRVAPVGLLGRGWPAERLYETAAASARATHTHPVGVDGAAVQARAVARACSLDPEAPFEPLAFVDELLRFARTEELRLKLATLHALLEHRAEPAEAGALLGQGVAVHESLPFALYCFLAHPRACRECLLCAVLHGGDRDTLGAMAGALSGAYLGEAALPGPWLARLEGRERLRALGTALARLASGGALH